MHLGPSGLPRGSAYRRAGLSRAMFALMLPVVVSNASTALLFLTAAQAVLPSVLMAASGARSRSTLEALIDSLVLSIIAIEGTPPLMTTLTPPEVTIRV